MLLSLNTLSPKTLGYILHFVKYLTKCIKIYTKSTRTSTKISRPKLKESNEKNNFTYSIGIYDHSCIGN